MKKKVVSLILAAVMVVATLVGCGNNGGETKEVTTAPKEEQTKAAEEEVVTLQFLANETPVLTREFWQIVVDKYTVQNPNVEIELVFQPSSNISVREHAKTLLSTGQFPDILVMPTPGDFVPSGALLPFEETDVDMINPDYISKMDGEIYVTPYKIQVGGVFYNKQIFKDNNLTVPETWDDFMKPCETLKSNSITPLSIGFKDAWPQVVPYFAIQTVDLLNTMPDWPAKRMANETSFASTPEFVEGVKKYAKLSNEYCPEDRSSVTYMQANEAFFNGKAAMNILGSWLQGDEMKTPHDFEVGLFPIPGNNGEKVMPLWVNEGLSISANTEHPEIAKDFVRFFVEDQEWASEFLATEQLFTPLKEVVVYESTPLHKEIEAMLPDYKGIANFYDTVGDNAWLPGVPDLINKFTLTIGTDPNVDIDKEIANLDIEFDKIIENNQK